MFEARRLRVTVACRAMYNHSVLQVQTELAKCSSKADEDMIRGVWHKIDTD